MDNISEYIKMENLRDGYLYRVVARNARYGIWIKEQSAFLICRVKLGPPYLFEEYHYDFHPNYGTAKPIEELEQAPFPIERLSNSCWNKDEHVLEYLRVKEGWGPEGFQITEFKLL